MQKRIEVSLSQDKIDLINNIHQKELEYWKEIENALDEDQANQLKSSAPLSFFGEFKELKAMSKYVKKVKILA